VLFDAMSALRVDLLLLGVRMLDQRLVDGAPAARGARADYPVLILHAEDDPVIAPSQGAKLAAAYGTRAHRVVLPGRGHGTGFAHAPGAHGAAIREFAASLR